MADYFASFSAEIPDLTPEEAAWIDQDLELQDTWDLDEAGGDALRERTGLPNLDGPWPDFAWEFDVLNNSLWLHAEDCFNLDHVISFVSRFIERFRPAYVFQMTWANTCSKPHVDAFGGGWLVVTKDRVLSGTTDQAVQEALDRLSGVYWTTWRYLVITTTSGVVDTPQVFDTQTQLGAYQEAWARESGYESFAEYQEQEGDSDDDLVWFELAIRASELSSDVTVSVA